MKKILFTASTNSHFMNFHLPYIKYFAENGYEVVSAGGGEDIAVPHCKKSVYIPFKKSLFSFGNIGCVFKLRKLIKNEQIDVISVHTTLAAALVRLSVKLMRNRPIVINTVHGYLFGKVCSKRKNKLLLMVEKIFRKQTDAIVVMNSEDYEIAATNKLTDGKLIKINGMGVNVERFLRSQRDEYFKKDLGFSESDIVMVFAGEFSPRKNQAFLINALAKLPECYKLLLLGKGALSEQCKALSAELSVSERVAFAGHIKDVERYYAAADVCVSASRIEGLPFGIVEAAAAGLPLVLSDVKGQRDLVESDSNGLLYPLDDMDGFISTLKSVAESGVDYRNQNRTLAKKYDIETVFDYNMRQYMDLIK